VRACVRVCMYACVRAGGRACINPCKRTGPSRLHALPGATSTSAHTRVGAAAGALHALVCKHARPPCVPCVRARCSRPPAAQGTACVQRAAQSTLCCASIHCRCLPALVLARAPASNPYPLSAAHISWLWAACAPAYAPACVPSCAQLPQVLTLLRTHIHLIHTRTRPQQQQQQQQHTAPASFPGAQQQPAAAWPAAA